MFPRRVSVSSLTAAAPVARRSLSTSSTSACGRVTYQHRPLPCLSAAAPLVVAMEGSSAITSSTTGRRPSLFSHSQPLLSPARMAAASSMESHGAAEMNSPYDCSIDRVLQPDASKSEDRSLKSLISLLLDPDAKNVENVSLNDFVAMVPQRQMKAVGNQREWLEVVLGSERYQACKDARTLRLAGITNVGSWQERRDQVLISSYSRGLLEQAHSALARHPRRQQNEEVLAWLTQAIQRAVRDEFTGSADAGNMNRTALLSPFMSEVQALPSTAIATSAATQAQSEAVEQPADDAAEADEGVMFPDVMSAAEDNELSEEVSRPGKTGKKSGGRKGSKHAAQLEDDDILAEDQHASRPAVRKAKTDEVEEDQVNANNNDEDDDDAEIARMMAEEDDAPEPYVRGSKKPSAATDKMQSSNNNNNKAAAEEEDEMMRASAEDDEFMVEEVEEIEVVEEVEEEEQPEPIATPVAAPPPPAAAAAAAASPKSSSPATGKTSNDKATEAKLRRLAELIVTQFNSADGYLHNPRKELKADEKNGSVVITDDDTAQVDPLSLFSTFHAAHVDANSPTEVQALKHIWNRFNARQMAMEDAKDEKVAMHERQKSVDALVHGAVLMRAISREEDVSLQYDDLVPTFGFPVLSSDRRPYNTKKPKASLHTDVTFMTVDAAVSAYKKYFANKEARSTPFLPKVDVNAGCGVVKLSGTTLHLYETSIKDGIEEEVVRPVFAEAMLGLLHVLQNKVLPRVNTVHYHILVTSLPQPSSSNNGTSLQPTNFVSVDLTGPFTSSERARLVALGEPLGLSKEQVNDFTCIEDIIMEIQDATGVSVVHDLLQNRDDLEALLTPTLVELLPEDGALDDAEEDGDYEMAAETKKNSAVAAEDDEELDVEEEEAEEEVRRPAVSSAKKAAKKQPARQHKTAAVEEEDAFEDAMEEEDVPPPPAAAAKASAPAKAAAMQYNEYHDDEEEDLYRRLLEEESEEAAASTNGAATTRKVLDEGDDEDVEALDDDEDLEEMEVPPPPAPRAQKSAAARNNSRVPEKSSKKVNMADDYDDDDAIDIDDEAEEEEPPVRRSSHSRRTSAVQSRAGRAPTPPPQAQEEELEADDDHDEEMEVVKAAPIPRAPAGRRAVPAPASASSRWPPVEYEQEENTAAGEEPEDTVVVPPPAPQRRAQGAAGRRAAAHSNPEDTAAAGQQQQQQWFKKRPKRRYFE